MMTLAVKRRYERVPLGRFRWVGQFPKTPLFGNWVPYTFSAAGFRRSKPWPKTRSARDRAQRERSIVAAHHESRPASWAGM